MNYNLMSDAERKAELAQLLKKYEEIKSQGISLDLSRGKPGKDQLDITTGMLGVISQGADCFSQSGLDCRNYGNLDGIPEAKALFSELLGISPSRIFIGGNSSLNMMYDAISRAMIYGMGEGNIPWSRQGKIKFICLTPGYDRHFAICESFGIEMVSLELGPDGPDMDEVENIVCNDPSVKGIWCVPKYSNPTGTVYSDETVRRFAAMKPAAPDFRIFWDNAYAVHDLTDNKIKLANIFDLADEYGTVDNILYFASTSKITFPGSGVAITAASEKNLAQIRKIISVQTIGHDKINQLRHVKYFQNANGVLRHMRHHAEIIRPKFEAVISALENDLGDTGIARWTNPKGGYFISLDITTGSAKRAWELAREAGVTLTNAGASFPYGKDPHDRNLRIAPTFPPLPDVRKASEVLTLCVRICALEGLLGK
ncbi:MAG: aminotransferase class I/II-fold pyridoxal phosphate-dependent enzyme [Clostridia bacterium]|nr:aminotransferase class I/II-fold pyridoxal phosphate-dependent enzyme [Clostridia bacterium]